MIIGRNEPLYEVDLEIPMVSSASISSDEEEQKKKMNLFFLHSSLDVLEMNLFNQPALMYTVLTPSPSSSSSSSSSSSLHQCNASIGIWRSLTASKTNSYLPLSLLQVNIFFFFTIQIEAKKVFETSLLKFTRFMWSIFWILFICPIRPFSRCTLIFMYERLANDTFIYRLYTVL